MYRAASFDYGQNGSISSNQYNDNDSDDYGRVRPERADRQSIIFQSLVDPGDDRFVSANNSQNASMLADGDDEEDRMTWGESFCLVIKRSTPTILTMIFF